MIMVGHTLGRWGFPSDLTGSFNLWQGVPFFFVLSGFILTYAYARLDEAGTRRFFVARFARLWPVHATTLLLSILYVAFGYGRLPPFDTLTALPANLAMMHAWVPVAYSYYSWNTPSWSISTELGFYVLFPLLVRFRRWWIVSMAVSLILLQGGNRLVRDLGLPLSSTDGHGIDVTGVMAVNPLTNVYLFVLGMGACLAYRRFGPRMRRGVLAGTALEIGVLAWNVWALMHVSTLFSWVPEPGVRALLSMVPGTFWSFPFLLVVMATQQGLVSRALSWQPFVLLGEISYALYLIHVPMQTWIRILRNHFPSMPDPFVVMTYWGASLIGAWLLWRYVECPMRRAIRGWYAGKETRLPDAQWHRAETGIVVLLATILVVLVAAVL
jgi:peptidoglycan/LPS O-acetylase OafA/YrhL